MKQITTQLAVAVILTLFFYTLGIYIAKTEAFGSMSPGTLQQLASTRSPRINL